MAQTETSVPVDTWHMSRYAGWGRLAIAVSELDDIALEENTYYGMGLTMDGMADRLEVSGRKARLTDDLGRALARRMTYDRLGSPQLAPNEIIGQGTNQVMRGLADESWQARTAPERALTSAAVAAITYRRLLRHDPSVGRGRPSASLLTYVHALLRPVPRIVAANALAGLTYVTVQMHTPSRHEATPKNIDMSLIRSPKFVQYAIQNALLRKDELSSGTGWSYSASGGAFDRRVLQQPPPALNQIRYPDHNHQERLRCPAIEANGLIRTLAKFIVPDALDIAYDAAAQADPARRRYINYRAHIRNQALFVVRKIIDTVES